MDREGIVLVGPNLPFKGIWKIESISFPPTLKLISAHMPFKDMWVWYGELHSLSAGQVSGQNLH